MWRFTTKETLELLEKFPTRYRWIQPHTTFDYIKPKESKFYDLKFRAVRFQISEETYETVYTNLDAKEFPIEKIKDLYHRRWGIETSFRELKYAIGLASLHGKKKEFMFQEVFARLVLYNYTSLIAHCVEIPEGKRVNISVATYFCRKFYMKKIAPSNVLESISKHLSAIRPGRQFHRYQNLISPIGFQYRISWIYPKYILAVHRCFVWGICLWHVTKKADITDRKNLLLWYLLYIFMWALT